EEATEELVARFPHEESNIRAYYGRWEEMMRGPIDETVKILKEIRETGKFKLYALTNWSAETFPVALKRFEFLQWFDGRLVSGEERMRKPFVEFYQLLIGRFNINPNTSVFIDDNVRNLSAPEELGIHPIHFRSPDQLRQDLNKLS